jgi:hypothetical protein
MIGTASCRNCKRKWKRLDHENGKLKTLTPEGENNK